MMGSPEKVEEKKVVEYDPFKVYAGLQKLLNDLFSQEAWGVPAAWWGNGLLSSKMKVDLSESDGGYRIVADLPGVKKEDISVSVDGNVVVISAEMKDEKQLKDGEAVVHSERHYGEIYRRFSLDKPVDSGKVLASYSDGVLEVTLPKLQSSQGKKIAVQ